MLELGIHYNDHQFPRVAVRFNGKQYFHTLTSPTASEDKGMELADYAEAFAFALDCIKGVHDA